MMWWITPVSVATAILCNQSLKMLLEGSRSAALRYGGFPSSHAAFTAAITTAIGVSEGASGAFWLALGFFGLTCYDALRLRSHHEPRDILWGAIIGVATTTGILLLA